MKSLGLQPALSQFVSYSTVLYSPRKYRTNRGSYSYCVVSYCVGFAVCRPIALYRSWFVSYRIVLCFGPTRSSDRVVLSRIVSRLHSHRSCLDRILIFPGLYQDFSQAVLYETYGTICGRHDTLLHRAWSVPIRIAMLWSDTYLWNWLHAASSIFFIFLKEVYLFFLAGIEPQVAPDRHTACHGVAPLPIIVQFTLLIQIGLYLITISRRDFHPGPRYLWCMS
jgi:hypothetical protein